LQRGLITEEYRLLGYNAVWFLQELHGVTEDGILHSHRRENLKSYIPLTGWTLQRRRNVSPVRYELGFISQKTTLFIVAAVKTSNLTILIIVSLRAASIVRMKNKTNVKGISTDTVQGTVDLHDQR
jgi:hypothetical protein